MTTILNSLCFSPVFFNAPVPSTWKVQYDPKVSMSNNSAVYQPTTVTYDDAGLTESQSQRRWSSTAANRVATPVSYLARAARGHQGCAPSRRTLATLYCSSSTACAAIGFTLVIHGAIGCRNSDDCSGLYVTVIAVGIITVLLSVLLLLLYLRHTRRCCSRFRRKSLNSPCGGVPSTLQPANVQLNNPSTDHLLVAAQPTGTSDAHPEHAQLMPKGTEEDPRILLRPLNAAQDVDDIST